MISYNTATTIKNGAKKGEERKGKRKWILKFYWYYVTIEIIRAKQMSVIFYEQRVDILISFRFNSKI